MRPLLALPLALSLGCQRSTPDAAADAPPPPLTARGDVVETLHGVEVADPYRWLEDADSDAVQAWTAARNDDFQIYTDGLEQQRWLFDRFQTLWRYDDESTPSPCLRSDRVLFWSKDADEDKWVVNMKDSEDAETSRILLDPNEWPATESLGVFSASPDCTRAVVGRTHAGDENAVLEVMDLDTLERIDAEFQGWKSGGIGWLPDSSGFYYSGKPLAEDAPDGDPDYWHRVWFHDLSGEAEGPDPLIFSDPEVKETWHGISASENGRWLIRYRGIFNKNGYWVRPAEGTEDDWVQVTGLLDAQYGLTVLGDTAFLMTDDGAPNYKVLKADMEALLDPSTPVDERWAPFIPESEDVLSGLTGVDGQLYAVYKHNTATRIALYDMEGTHQRDMTLPSVGSASIWGFWDKGPTWVSFSSFAHPGTTYTYDVGSDALALYEESPIPVDPELIDDIHAEQVWYTSKDGVEVSMFLIHRQDIPLDGSTPFLLYGYGGFNVSLNPRFSTVYTAWVEAGGGVAVANLRGGGEYGVAWHEAGMRDQKQNVFDDFIAAGEWLIEAGYTASDRLAINGGSNGGLLVSAAVTQRPDLFQAALCEVPLTDMIRYHRFGIAEIWAEEYGHPDDPEMFPHLLAYSPYHNVTEGDDYPALLVTGSENDARTDPVHARKFYAAAQWADADRGGAQPIFLHIQSDSGHGGGVTIDDSAEQRARHMGFLMEQIGLQAPDGEPLDDAPSPD